ncbi:hypothetical protein F4859DRAFT_282106 [Xylaria cf. heliscus]|nr:hypothetical protein F4859DRAFT_282106 [Xylaria cf. heliscus]
MFGAPLSPRRARKQMQRYNSILTAIISFYFSEGVRYRSQALWEAVVVAIMPEDYSIIRLLASHRSVQKVDENEVSSLILAIEECGWDLAFLLLQHPFIPSPVTAYNYDKIRCRTPLCAAFLSQNQSVVDEIIKRGYVPQFNDIWVLMKEADGLIQQAFWDRFPLESVELPCQHVLLLHAIESGNTQKVHECIKIIDCGDFSCEPYYIRGCHRNVKQALELAVIKGNPEGVLLLLDAGARVNPVA